MKNADDEDTDNVADDDGYNERTRNVFRSLLNNVQVTGDQASETDKSSSGRDDVSSPQSSHGLNPYLSAHQTSTGNESSASPQSSNSRRESEASAAAITQPRSPGRPKMHDYQKDDSPTSSYTSVNSHASKGDQAEASKGDQEEATSPHAEDSRNDTSFQRGTFQSSTFPLSAHQRRYPQPAVVRHTPTDSQTLTLPHIDEEGEGAGVSPTLYKNVKSPTLSDKSEAYRSLSEGKSQNSSADADTFYSLDNSPEDKSDKSDKTVQRQDMNSIDIMEGDRAGFSLFEDIVLRGEDEDEFSELVSSHIENFGSDTICPSSTPEHSNVAKTGDESGEITNERDSIASRSDAHKNVIPSRDKSVEKDTMHRSILTEAGSEKKSRYSVTLESIPLTKESIGDVELNESRRAGDDSRYASNCSVDTPPILPKRHVLLFLLFLGFAVVYSLRVNINVAIVAMVNNRTRLNDKGRIEILKAEFDWNSHTQGLVIGAFYYGYWILQVPGAWIAMKLGATRIFGYGVLLAALLSLVTPVATRYHVLGIVGVRVAQGLVLGVTYPCVIAIWANWAPPLERSTMVTMTMAGSPVGNIIAIPVTGILAKYGFDGGWPSVFYFFGFLGVLWYIVWECVIYDKPINHPNISTNEKRYIEKAIDEKAFDPLVERLPWLAIFTSIPMWAIIFGHFGACWGYYTLFTQMPTYLKDIQHLDIKTMGLVAATPYLLKALLGPIGGISADMLLKAKYMSVRGVRILFYGIGCIFAGFFILMTGYYVRKGEAITFLILGIGFSGLNTTGYAVNHLDIAPRYAGILMGISNTFATIPGFLSPMLTGIITKNKRSSEWKIVFWVTFIVYCVAVLLYSLMCSGEKQWWAEGDRGPPVEEEAEEEVPVVGISGDNEYDGDTKVIANVKDDTDFINEGDNIGGNTAGEVTVDSSKIVRRQSPRVSVSSVGDNKGLEVTNLR